MNSKRAIRAAGIALACALLTSCASVPQPADSEPRAARLAAAAQARGEWEQAAQLWEQAATDAAITGRTLEGYRLNAADAWKLAGDSTRATQWLRQVNSSALKPVARNRYALLNAELALDAGNAETAEFYLDVAAENLDLSLRPRYLAGARRLEALRSDPHAPALGDAERLLSRMGAYQPQAALDILVGLESVPSGRLQAVAAHPSRLADWAALAAAVRQAMLNPDDLLPAATAWEAQHPAHEVDAAAFLEIGWLYQQRFAPPRRIAVLLPQQGNLAAAAAAIRDGLVSALLRSGAPSSLDFLPIDEDPVSALMAYSRAAETGYDWVIGPLRRQSTAMIAELERPAIPVLLLNEPGFAPAPVEDGQPRVFSLSLSQAEEARSAARRMLVSGHRRVILLLADNEWAERTQAAFSDEFQAGGGAIVAQGWFGGDAEQHAGRLAELLKIEDSRQRKDALQAALRMPLDFEPTRRDDFDAFFLAVDPVLGRQIKPQLRFFDAGGKNMVAMSRIFSGTVDAAADQDLNGISFAATRGAFEPARGDMSHLTSVRSGAFRSLLDLGQDAWNVLPWLDLMTGDPDLAYPGQVGQLRLMADGRLWREPAWARFERGRPVPEPELRTAPDAIDAMPMTSPVGFARPAAAGQ